jgi:hypothetical protein
VKKTTDRTADVSQLAKKVGAGSSSRSTRVRTRCAGTKRTLAEEVAVQVERSKRAIVRAQVLKAKEGSLAHTKWLWSYAEKARLAGEEVPEISLAEILLSSLERESKRDSN